MKEGTLSLMAVGLIAMVISCISNNRKEDREATGQKTDTVIIKGMQFQPANLILNKGDTVVWINQDIVVHNVTQDTTQIWTSGDIEMNGGMWKMAPDTSFNYLCSILPTMKGRIVIVSK